MNMDDFGEWLERSNRKQQIINQSIAAKLMELPREELIEQLRQFDDDLLLWVCEGIALASEAYEICSAVNVVKKERGLE